MAKTGWALRWFLGLLVGAAVAGGAQAQETEVLEPVVEDSPTVFSDEGGLPCDFDAAPPRWETWGSLLYLRPGSGNLEYATLVSPLPLPTPNWANQALSPNLTPAFTIGARYAVPATGHDIRATWTHLDASANASVTAAPNQFVGPAFEIGPDASLFQVAQGNVNFKYDSVTFDAGQLLASQGRTQVRVFVGLEYARIVQTLDAHFRSEDGLVDNGNTNNSQFNGVGPRLGMRASTLHGNFDLLGEIAGSVLAGPMQSRLDFSARSPELGNLGIDPPNVQSITSPNVTQVVPALDAKLGGGYNFLWHGCFRVEAGYRAAVYVNAISRYSITEVNTPPVDQSVGVFLRTADHLQTNFTVHGPYASLTWAY